MSPLSVVVRDPGWQGVEPVLVTTPGLGVGELGLQAARRLGDRRAEARMLQALGFAEKAAGRIFMGVGVPRSNGRKIAAMRIIKSELADIVQAGDVDDIGLEFF